MQITHGIEGLDSGMFFKYRTDNGTRGHRWALAKERCKLDIRKYAFSQRTINEWNRLPGECVNATSVNKLCAKSIRGKLSAFCIKIDATPNQKKHRAAHSAAHGQPMGSRVGCPWAAHAMVNLPCKWARCPLFCTFHGSCPWAAHGQAKLICMFH